MSGPTCECENCDRESLIAVADLGTDRTWRLCADHARDPRSSVEIVGPTWSTLLRGSERRA